MHKWIMFVLIIGAAVLGIGALFSQVSTNAKENAPDPNADKKLIFTVSNYKFDQPEYTVKVGETKTLVLKINEGLHEVGIKDLNVHLKKSSPEAEVTFDKAGTYEVRCELPCGPGHATMAAKLVVTE
ncbi:hypothetical protein [Gorillibacterium massiliense]|uniref:hypothetical protein n=1 Tax=Gorillibacterium massiliense TaxID=1280390 RepID=UPI0004B5166A|nr:hypothetical protein [Gorillibacterium massiliense]